MIFFFFQLFVVLSIEVKFYENQVGLLVKTWLQGFVKNSSIKGLFCYTEY